MRAARLLFLRQVKYHPVRSLIAIVSVAAGVSMALSIMIVVESTNRSIEAQARVLAGPAPLRVVGSVPNGGMDGSVVGEIAGTEGVAAAVPMVQAITFLHQPGSTADIVTGERSDDLGPEVVVLGINCETAELFGQSCDQGPQLAIGPALARTVDKIPPGSVVGLRSTTGPVPLDDAEQLDVLDNLASGMVAVMPLQRAQQLYHREGSVDVVYVLPDEGVPLPELKERIQTNVGEHRAVLEATDPPPSIKVLIATIVPFFGILALLALGVGLVLVGNTVTLSLTERRKELAVVAAVGATDRTLIGGALTHAAVLGVVGGLLGSVAALLLAIPLTAALSDFTQELSGMTVDLHPRSTPVVVAIVAGAAVAVAASWRPARRALRIDIAAEMSGRERRSETSVQWASLRALTFTNIGLLGMAGTYVGSRRGGLEPWQFPVAMVSLVVATVGLIMASGAVVPLLGRAISSLRLPMPNWLQLGTANLFREPGRTGVMAVAIGAAVGTAFMAASFNQSAEAGITEGITTGLDGRLQINPGPVTNTAGVDTFIPPDVTEAITNREDVAAVERGAVLLVGTDRFTGVSSWQSRGGDPNAPVSEDFEVFDGTAELGRFQAGEVLIGAGLARTEGLRAGDVLRLPARNGMAELPVQGVWSNGDFNGNAVNMPLARLEKLYGTQPPRWLHVRPAEGVSTDDLAERLRSELAGSTVRIYTPEELAAEVSEGVSQQLAPFWIVQRGLTFVAFVAVLTTMLLTAIQRRRELGVLAAVGMEPGMMRRMILAESAAMAVLAVAVSTVSSVAMYVALREAGPLLLGWQNPMRLAWWTIPIYGSITLGVAVLGAVLPAWHVSRTNIVEALSYE